MTGLLVSVRNLAEAASAWQGGAAIIDLKEPFQGALGACEPAVWHEVLDWVQGQNQHLQVSALSQPRVVSVALGELQDAEIFQRASAVPRGIAFAKVGLAGFRGLREWANRLAQVAQQLNAGCQLVPVVYADYLTAGAASPEAVLTFARQECCPLVLVDTCDKRQGGLLSYWDLSRLGEFIQAAFQAEIRVVLAGSIEIFQVAELLSLHPAYIGVRGAACEGGRTGTIQLELVGRLVREVETSEEAVVEKANL